MILYATTVTAIQAMLCCFLGGQLIFARRGRDFTIHRTWTGLGLFIVGTGWFLFTLRGYMSNWLSVDVALALVLLGLGVMRQSTRLLTRVGVNYQSLIGGVVGYVVVRLLLNPFNDWAAFLCAYAVLMAAYPLRFSEDVAAAQGNDLYALKLLRPLYLVQMLIYLSPIPWLIFEGAGGGYLRVTGAFAMMRLADIVVLTGGVVLSLLLERERSEQLRTAAGSIDSASGIFDDQAFRAHAAAAVAGAVEQNQPASVVALQLDGALSGSVSLAGFCTALGDVLRPCDILGEIGAGRLAICLPNVGEEDLPLVIRAVAGRFTTDGTLVGIGSACSEQVGHSIADLLAAATEAVAKSASAKRRRWVAYRGPGAQKALPHPKPERAAVTADRVGRAVATAPLRDVAVPSAPTELATESLPHMTAPKAPDTDRGSPPFQEDELDVPEELFREPPPATGGPVSRKSASAGPSRWRPVMGGNAITRIIRLGRHGD